MKYDLSSSIRMNMNCRERVLRAIRFQKPDRAPLSHAVLPAAQIKYGAALDEILQEYPEDFGWDYMSDLPPGDYPAPYRAGRNRDDFGTLWQTETLGICGIPVEWPDRRPGSLRRVPLAGGFHRRTADRAAVQRTHGRLRSSAGMRAGPGLPISSSSSSYAACRTS